MKSVKSALKLGLKPSAHLLASKNPRGNWSPEDHLLARAFQILEDELCPHCGWATWVCQSGNQWLGWSVSDYVCAAEVAKAASSKKEDKPGHYKVARPKMRKDEMAMPTRDEYYAELTEEATVHKKRKVKSR